MVEDRLEQVGARVEIKNAFQPNVIVEMDRLVTAQNSQSSDQFAKTMKDLYSRIK
jgi:uncharacterized coiled-coil protein SlyX